MFGLAINLLGIRKAIGGAFAWATQSAAHIFAIGMVFALAWGWLGHHKADKLAKVLASTEQAYRNAQADAKLAQEALNARHVATNEAINKGSTNDNAKGLSAARSAVADYARMHQCPKGSPGQADPAAVSDRAEMDSGTSAAPAMVAVTVADLDTLAAGTVRAESCRAWGQSLIDAGLAEAAD